MWLNSSLNDDMVITAVRNTPCTHAGFTQMIKFKIVASIQTEYVLLLINHIVGWS